MEKNDSLQNVFLNTAKNEKIPLTISLTNGLQFRGLISEYDDCVIFLEADNKFSMIYKQSIASITPGKLLKID